MIERGEDRARTGSAAATFTSKPVEGIASAAEFPHLGIQGGDARLREFSDTRAILPFVEVQKFADLVQGETGSLRLPDEAQSAEIVGIVAPDAAVARRSSEQSLALIKADCFHADSAALCKRSNREAKALLTLYHGTEVIWYGTEKQGGLK